MLGTLAITFAVFFGLQRYATDPEFFRELGLGGVSSGGVGPPGVREGPAGPITREAFERRLAEVAPDRRLSRGEIDLAQAALIRQRAARSALASLPAEAANAERRRSLVEAIGRASSEFRALVGLDPLEFTGEAEAPARPPRPPR